MVKSSTSAFGHLAIASDNGVLPLIRIPYRQLKVSLELERAAGVSSFLAATLRGGFGYTLKRLVCAIQAGDCRTCLLAGKCVYAFLFESLPSENACRLRKYQQIPRPFALRPHQEESRIYLSLLLVGEAVSMLPYVILALRELGKHGIGKGDIPFTVAQVCTETDACVYHAENAEVCKEVEPLSIEVQSGATETGSVTLKFKSPMVLRKDGAVLSMFEPYAFLTTLLRRVTNLNAFYGTNREVDIDPAPYIHSMETLDIKTEMHPVEQSRFSTRQKKNIDYSGIVGSVELRGDVGPLMPLLRAGAVLGVGKNTVFGFGEYDLTPLSPLLSKMGT